jgi:hypothetical protein
MEYVQEHEYLEQTVVQNNHSCICVDMLTLQNKCSVQFG